MLGNFTLWDLPSGSLSPHAMFDSGFFLYIGCALFKLGALAFAFLVPALAGYIAYGIADRPGIAPGFTAGAVCVLHRRRVHRRSRRRYPRRLRRAVDRQASRSRAGHAA